MKTDKHIRYMVPVIWALLAVFFRCTACSFYNSAISPCSSMEIKWENGGISPIALVGQQSYAKQDGTAERPKATLWKAHPDREVRTADKKSMIADAVPVFGDCRGITTAIVLYGSFPAQSDQSGCAVSLGLTFSLWGSTEVLKLPIKIEGNVFYVRDVFKEKEPRLFHQVQAESKEPLSNMQLNSSGTGTNEGARQYLPAAGFPERVPLELPLIGQGLDILFGLPAMVLSLGTLIRAIRRECRLWHYPLLLAFYLPPVLAASAASVICMDLPEMPAGFIPAMWSDFEFWQNLFLGYWKNLVAWILAIFTFRDVEFMAASFMTISFSLAASVCAAKAAILVSIRTYRSMVLGCTAYTLTLSLLSLHMAWTRSMMFCKAMYVMPCLWLCVDFMFNRRGEELICVPHERRFSDNKSKQKKTV